MKKFICFVLTAALIFSCTAAFAENNMTLTQYGDDPNYTEVMVNANNIKKNSDGSVTFNGEDKKTTYIIDDDTDIYENSTYAAYEDKFLTSEEYTFIDFYALKSETEKGETVHVAAINSLSKGVVNFAPETNAASNLIDLGIIIGDLTGNLRYEDAVTRAEMAAIVCRLLGMKDMPEGSEQVFTDVPVGHWASAYIDSARNANIINGNGDGTFRPEDKVTYDEAIKMLASLIGYEPKARGMGGYPEGFEKAADEISLTDGIVYNGTDFCLRSDVMIMCSRALDIPLMSQTSYGENAGYIIMDGTNGAPYHTLRTDIFGG